MVNVTKFPVSCGFGRIYWEGLWCRSSFFVQFSYWVTLYLLSRRQLFSDNNYDIFYIRIKTIVNIVTNFVNIFICKYKLYKKKKTNLVLLDISTNNIVGSPRSLHCQMIFLFKTFTMLWRIFTYALGYLVMTFQRSWSN